MDNKIKEDEMGGTYSTHGSNEKCLFNVGPKNLNERDNM
jgi:hypothetical protein